MIETWYNKDKKNKERRYKGKFYKTFKSITFDNGVEFMEYKGLEKSCLRKKEKTSVYYAHPYCSGKRGSNENNNRLIRRFIPKGMEMTNIKISKIKEIENWINDYPRAMFDYNIIKYINNLHFSGNEMC